MSVWVPIIDKQIGYLFGLSASIAIVEANNPGLLASVANSTMIVASDYSGQHKGATHEAYSFLVTTDEALNNWLPSLGAFRQRWLPDGRRISFKKLNEPLRRQALWPFLDTVAGLSGNLITILVNRQIGSFISGGSEAAKDAFPDCFPANVSPGTVEKMLRLASFVALILSGLRREDQLSYWVSDHDEALDSYERREQFARLATYLTFGATGWRRAADNQFDTTESSTAPHWSEDLTAVADLAAGAYCQLSSYLPAFSDSGDRENWTIRMASSDVDSLRARAIGDWLAKRHGALKHVLLRLELDREANIRISAQAFLASA